MAKGGKGGSVDAGQMLAMQQAMNQQNKPTPVDLVTTGYGGMGYNYPQAPQVPSWASGNWAMPWYGQAQQGQAWGQPQTQPPTSPSASQAQPGIAGGKGKPTTSDMNAAYGSYFGSGTPFASPGVGWDQWKRSQDQRREMWSNSGLNGGSGNLYG